MSDKKSSLQPAASTPQIGPAADPLLRLMARLGIPATRENYLELSYMGEVPQELSAEEEMYLPEQFRRPLI
jgi:hypothetical protein